MKKDIPVKKNQDYIIDITDQTHESMGVGMKNNETTIGLYAERSHEIVDTNTCLIWHKTNDEIMKAIRKFIKDYNISACKEATGTSLVRYIVNKVGFKTGEVMICIVINGEDIPYSDKLIEVLRKNITSIFLPSKPCSNSKIIRKSIGICRPYRQRNCDRRILRYKHNITFSKPKS